MMNNGVPLDVFKIVERLETGGVPHEQAKAQATVLSDVISSERKRADTLYLPRGGLTDLLAPIKAAIERLDAKVDRIASESRSGDAVLAESLKSIEARLDEKIARSAAEVKSEIIRWTVALWFLQAGLVTTLLFSLPG